MLTTVKDEAAVSMDDESGRRLATIEYHRGDDGALVVDHTFVSDELRGQGVGAKLVAEVVILARAAGAKIRSNCSYATKVIEREAGYLDVRGW